MANTFKNITRSIPANPGVVLYTTPPGITSVIHTVYISNVSTLPENVTVYVNDASSSTSFRVMNDVPVPVGGTLYLPKPINLEAGDSIRLVSSATDMLEVYAGILEIS